LFKDDQEALQANTKMSELGKLAIQKRELLRQTAELTNDCSELENIKQIILTEIEQ
jgi:hypothetical protein